MTEPKRPSKEVWKDVEGFNGKYQVSNLGRVRTIRFINGYSNFLLKKPTIRKQATLFGYKLVRLSDGNKMINYRVHRLVLETFLGKSKLPQCCHKNGISHDNRLENLYWASAKQNAKDRKKHGTAPVGERHGSSKLKWTDVREIRISYKNGARLKDLSEKYNITSNSVSRIVKNEGWIE